MPLGTTKKLYESICLVFRKSCNDIYKGGLKSCQPKKDARNFCRKCIFILVRSLHLSLHTSSSYSVFLCNIIVYEDIGLINWEKLLPSKRNL